VSRVLLVRLSAMGDLVQSLGAVVALRDARPDVEPVLLTQRAYAPLLQGLRGVAVVEHDRRGGIGAVLRTARTLRALRCATALDLQGNWKSAALALLSGARERIGAGAAWRQEPWSRVLLTRTVATGGERHPARVAAALVRELAPGAVIGPPRLEALPAEIDAVTATVRAHGIDAARPFRVVTIAPPDDPRAQRPAALAAELALGALPTLALLGPGEADLAVPGDVAVLQQGAGALRELVALGALVARVGGEVVGPDHGPLHVLAAAGARTTALFGPQDPRCTAPPQARVLQHATPPACMPCRSRRCRHQCGPVCMDFTSATGRLRP